MVLNHLINGRFFFKDLWNGFQAREKAGATQEPTIQPLHQYKHKNLWHEDVQVLQMKSTTKLNRFSPLFRYSVLLLVLLLQIIHFLLFPLLYHLLLVVVLLLKQEHIHPLSLISRWRQCTVANDQFCLRNTHRAQRVCVWLSVHHYVLQRFLLMWWKITSTPHLTQTNENQAPVGRTFIHLVGTVEILLCHMLQ